MRQSAIPHVAALLLALLAAGPAQATDYGYRVLDQKPQPRDHFVQGLQIVDGKLYVSTGRYGESRLLRYNFADSRLEGGRKLHPRLWGEGLTVLGDTLYQLTWRARLLLVYDRPDLDYRESFALPGEGWGITHNGRELIYSDGSHRLHYLAPDSGEYLRSITVTENGMPVPELNELEWVDGAIWANVFRTDRIVIIDPNTGAVTGGIDLTGLLPAAERRPDTSVLNGIAVDPADDGIWVTGKRWPWIYRIELVEPDESSGTRSSGTRSSGTDSSGAAASKPSPHSVSPR
jgi:glutamine cyclotransferase